MIGSRFKVQGSRFKVQSACLLNPFPSWERQEMGFLEKATIPETVTMVHEVFTEGQKRVRKM
jgi:hypothetical protein